jgi:DNA-binding transcriptional LysR family regulator
MSFALKTRHLQVFLAVAKTGSMQHAARGVGLTQPAISKLIVELERIFGAPLFERSKRGVTPTECGCALMDRAQLMLNDIESAKGEILAIARGAVGRVRVGVLPVAETPMLSRTLLALRKSAPGLAVQVEDGTRPVLLSSLRRGELDCMISRLDVGAGDQDLHVEKLVRMPISIVVSPSHPLARAKRVSWSDLARYSWILPRPGSPIRTVIDQQFAHAGTVPPAPMIESTSIRLNQAVLAGTDMIGVMIYDAAHTYARSRELAILPVKFFSQPPYIGVITRSPQASHALGTFLAALRAQCKAEH